MGPCWSVAQSMGKRRRKTEPRRRDTTVHDLPDECLALVFPFLRSTVDRNAASLTCRRWRALDSLSRHSLRFSCCEEAQWPLVYPRFLHVLKIFPHILSLYVSNDPPASFVILFQTKAFSQLQSLAFWDSSARKPNDPLVQCVAGCCPALRHLALSMSGVTDVGLCALAHGCRHLESLDVSLCRVTDKGVDTLLTMCPSLEDLDVSQNYMISGWAFRHGKTLRRLVADFMADDLTEASQMATGPNTLYPDHVTVDIEALGEGCPSLAVIGMCCKLLVELRLPWSTLSDSSLQAIARGCLNLKVLGVEYCHNITVSGWQEVALSCRKLELLSMNGCKQFCIESLYAIYRGCPSLTYLQISERPFRSHLVFKLFQMYRQSVDVAFYNKMWRRCP